MKKMKAVLLTLIMIVVSINMSVYATTVDTNEVDEFLLSLGMQRVVVDNMSELHKFEIFNALRADDIDELRFESFSLEAYIVPEDGDGRLVSELIVSAEDMFVPFNTIPSSDLQLTVSVFRGITSRYGETFFVFPGFQWFRTGSIRNGGFAVAMFPGWVVAPSHFPTFRIMATCIWHGYNGSAWLDPSTASHAGYGWNRFPMPIFLESMVFEGISSMQVLRTDPNAVRGISMHYVRDTLNPFTASFGFSIGPASITVTGNSSRLSHMARNLGFSY
ncbi:MAG: hypothetical protein FWC92_09535 [Defluviitaleaceae bacterium]|nr:hypothetical protein [Defluviitaleaceae bacterium]